MTEKRKLPPQPEMHMQVVRALEAFKRGDCRAARNHLLVAADCIDELLEQMEFGQ